MKNDSNYINNENINIDNSNNNQLNEIINNNHGYLNILTIQMKYISKVLTKIIFHSLKIVYFVFIIFNLNNI